MTDNQEIVVGRIEAHLTRREAAILIRNLSDMLAKDDYDGTLHIDVDRFASGAGQVAIGHGGLGAAGKLRWARGWTREAQA